MVEVTTLSCVILGMANKLNKLLTWLVTPTPNALDACESCRKHECTQELWEKCPDRLRVKAVLDRTEPS